jgi:hypothetical protein
LPNGSYVNLGFCTPKAKIGGAICAREADCPAGQGCVSYGARTNLLACKAGGPKSLGEKCTRATECRSGQCFDREFHAEANQSFCSGACGKSSDCGADQRCARVVLSNNNTPADPRDDLVAGLCQSLFVPIAADGCKTDADCTAVANGGDTCSKKYGLCYTAGAASGAACTTDQSCELGALCMTGGRFRGGYCQTLGCAPGAAAGSVDSCPGAHSTCIQRGSEAPLYACYEGCAKTAECSRVAESYACESPTTVDGGASDAGAADAGAADAADAGATDAGQLPSICIFNMGV